MLDNIVYRETDNDTVKSSLVKPHKDLEQYKDKKPKTPKLRHINNHQPKKKVKANKVDTKKHIASAKDGKLINNYDRLDTVHNKPVISQGK